MANTVTGFWRNLKTGREMLSAFPAERVQEATRAFLRAAEGLLSAWGAYRTGKASAAFRGDERAYLDASATLTEMHMVAQPVRKLDGGELLDERERLASLAAFPDQSLVAPVMGAVKNRAAQIAAYTSTPDGQCKISEEESRRSRVRAEREAQERRQAAETARAALERQRQEEHDRAEQVRQREPEPEDFDPLDFIAPPRTSKETPEDWWDRKEREAMQRDLPEPERPQEAPKVQSEAERDREALRAVIERENAEIRRQNEERENDPKPYSGPSGPGF